LRLPSVEEKAIELWGRLNKSINQRNQLVGIVDVQSVRSDNSHLFNFLDMSRMSAINNIVQWTTRPTQRFAAILLYFGTDCIHHNQKAVPHAAGRFLIE
jgi:hypothetical protein